jgi:hypothetical protein
MGISGKDNPETLAMMSTDTLRLSQSKPVLSSFLAFHRIINMSNTTGGMYGAGGGPLDSCGAHEFTLVL